MNPSAFLKIWGSGGSLLAWLVAMFAGSFVAFAVAPDTNRFNVLFIAVDDLRPELGCYGVDYAPSPNMDRLAAQGTVFTRHYVQVPTCGASRYAMLTGRSPAKTKSPQSKITKRGNHLETPP